MASELLSGRRIWALAHNTFREAIRNRAFPALALAAVALIAFSLVLSKITVIGQGPRVVVDFGLFAIGLFSALTAIVMGTLLMRTELQKKTVYAILSKPVHRYEFILGKYFGMLSLLLLEVAFLAVAWALVLWGQGVEVGLEHVKGLLLIYFEVSLIAAAALMFGVLSSPLVAALLSSGLFLVGRSVHLLDTWLGGDHVFFEQYPAVIPFVEATTAVMPDLYVFNISQQVLAEVETSWAYVGEAMLYSGGYALVFVGLAIVIFQRRDFV